MILLMFIIFLNCAVRCDNNYYVIEMSEDPPNNRVPLNDPPFEVYWNVPTMQCTSKKILFDDLYKKYGIIQNEGDSFRGDRIAILYDPGIFPAIFKNDTSGKLRFRNGGVPQEGDLQKHLEEFKDIMNQSVIDKDFDGIGIIDFESWRPIYRQNFGVLSPYKDVSYEIERNNHWWWPQGMVTAEAKRRFEESARTFMESTLVAAKQLRPLAKWGYYGFPYCFNSKTERCADKVSSENDHISWLWSESSALYPSVYSSKDLSPYQLSQYVKGRVDEAARARRGRAKGDVPILPYFWYRYRDGGYLREEDLQIVLKTFDSSDANGFIIWGSSSDVNTVDKCVKLLNYVDNVLGPAVAKYTKPKRNIDGVGESISYSTGTEYGVTSEIYDKVTENDNKHNKTDVSSLVNAVNNVSQSENDTKVHLNESVSDTKILIDIFNNNLKENENKTNNSETINLSNTKQSEHNIETLNKSSFSVYSAVDSTIIDKIVENMFSTEITEVVMTTEKANQIEFDEYSWDPPENYSKDIFKYVEEEFTKHRGRPNISISTRIRYEESSFNNKENRNENISPSEEISHNTKADKYTLYDFIIQKLLEYRNKGESHLPLKEVLQSQTKNTDVNFNTELNVSSTNKVNNSLEHSHTDTSEESKEKQKDCMNYMNKMKDKKKECSMMMKHNMGKGHNHGKETTDEENNVKSEETSNVHEKYSSNYYNNKEPDKILENYANNHMDLHIMTSGLKEYLTEISSISYTDHTTKQTTAISDNVQSERDESKIKKEEIQVINEMMFPKENSKNITNENFLTVNITALEIENVKNSTDNLDLGSNSSTELREKIKEITFATEKYIDILHVLFDNTETSSERTENHVTGASKAESTTIESITTKRALTECAGTETPSTEITIPEITLAERISTTESIRTGSDSTGKTETESTSTESSATESTRTKSLVTTAMTTARSTENIEENNTNKNFETTTNKEDRVDLIKVLNITNEISKSMTKNEKKGRAININTYTIKQPEKTETNEKIRSKPNIFKNMKKGLPKFKDEYETFMNNLIENTIIKEEIGPTQKNKKNIKKALMPMKSKDEYDELMKNEAEKTIINEEIQSKESNPKNLKKGLPMTKLKIVYENSMNDELPFSEELVSSDFITEKVTGSTTKANSSHAIYYYLCFLVIFVVHV